MSNMFKSFKSFVTKKKPYIRGLGHAANIGFTAMEAKGAINSLRKPKVSESLEENYALGRSKITVDSPFRKAFRQRVKDLIIKDKLLFPNSHPQERLASVANKLSKGGWKEAIRKNGVPLVSKANKFAEHIPHSKGKVDLLNHLDELAASIKRIPTTTPFKMGVKAAIPVLGAGAITIAAQEVIRSRKSKKMKQSNKGTRYELQLDYALADIKARVKQGYRTAKAWTRSKIFPAVMRGATSSVLTDLSTAGLIPQGTTVDGDPIRSRSVNKEFANIPNSELERRKHLLLTASSAKELTPAQKLLGESQIRVPSPEEKKQMLGEAAKIHSELLLRRNNLFR